MRILIDLPPEQITHLATLSKSQNISRAELIRRAVSQYLENNQPKPVKAFGLLKDRKIDGSAWQEQVRSQW